MEKEVLIPFDENTATHELIVSYFYGSLRAIELLRYDYLILKYGQTKADGFLEDLEIEREARSHLTVGQRSQINEFFEHEGNVGKLDRKMLEDGADLISDAEEAAGFQFIDLEGNVVTKFDNWLGKDLEEEEKITSYFIEDDRMKKIEITLQLDRFEEDGLKIIENEQFDEISKTETVGVLRSLAKGIESIRQAIENLS